VVLRFVAVWLFSVSHGTLTPLTRELKPIRIRQSPYLNNRIEQDHRSIKRRVRPMLGFKSIASARTILGGIELVHMMRKGQAKYACNPQPSLAE
jgi:putative transposase